jgi:hypothetical protein
VGVASRLVVPSVCSPSRLSLQYLTCLFDAGKDGLSFDKTGELPTADGHPRGVAQDCWIASITKAEWEEEGGVRELVARQMARTA